MNDINKSRSLELATNRFFKEFLDDDQYRLQRSLLSFDNYLAKDGANRTFCREVYRTVRHRNENWRKVFDSANKRKILQR